MSKLQNFWWRHGYEIKAFISTASLLILILTLIIAPIVTTLYFIEKNSCESKAEMMGIESDYAFPKGCMWKINGQWIPKMNYMFTEAQNEEP